MKDSGTHLCLCLCVFDGQFITAVTERLRSNFDPLLGFCVDSDQCYEKNVRIILKCERLQFFYLTDCLFESF